MGNRLKEQMTQSQSCGSAVIAQNKQRKIILLSQIIKQVKDDLYIVEAAAGSCVQTDRGQTRNRRTVSIGQCRRSEMSIEGSQN